MTDLPMRVDGPKRGAAATLVFAHGAGAGMEHEWMQAMTERLVQKKLRIVRFEFAYMAARREGRRPGPDRLPKLQAAFRDVIAAAKAPAGRLVLAGKSMGGRVATTIADDVEAQACVALGYPFHPPGKPESLRTEHLLDLRTQTLVLQGERDPFGTPDEVKSYGLSKAIGVQWLPDGDHSLKPRKKSGFTLEQHLDTACDALAAFVAKAVR
ncbi:MAG: alpha/beta family hydrolase [Planctomycetota bacterium]